MILSSRIRRNADSRAQSLVAVQQTAQMPKHPIILCHGLFGFDTLFGTINYWNEIPETLKAAGAEVYVARVPAISAVEARATALKEQIAEKYPGRSVHLIGHSMGGLDCRYLVTHLLAGAGFKVLSVSTIATPHRGSAAADVVVATRVDELQSFRSFLNMFPSGDGDGKAFASLSTANTQTFNACTPDAPGVRYFSWGASFVPGVIDTAAWGATFAILQAKNGSNDGVVAVTSAQWGKYLGTKEGVNHTEIIGHKMAHSRPTDALNFLTGQSFDHRKFFLEHASILAREADTFN